MCLRCCFFFPTVRYMELLVLVGLAIVGRSRRAPTTTPVDPLLRPDAYPFDDDNTVASARKDEQRLVSQSLQHATERTHAAGETFHDNLKPFFRSEGTQNTNDNVKTTRMELFTGSMDVDASQTGTYQHKTERAPLFSVTEGVTNTTGTPVEGEETRLRHFTASQKRHGMSADPNARLQVGPGLGVGPETVAAGGFHPESVVRVMPDNVNEHRINQLENRVLAGGASVGSGQLGMSFVQNKEARLFAGDSRPPQASAATVHAATQRATTVSTYDPKRGLETPYGGPGGDASGYAPVPGQSRDQRDGFGHLPLADTGSAAVPACKSFPMVADPNGSRGQVNTYSGSAASAVPGEGFRHTLFDLSEQRMQTPLSSHGAYNGGERVPSQYALVARETPTQHLTAPSTVGGVSRVPMSYSFNSSESEAPMAPWGAAHVSAPAGPLQNAETRSMRSHVQHTPGPMNVNLRADAGDIMQSPWRDDDTPARADHGYLAGTYTNLGAVNTGDRALPSWREPIMHAPL